MLISLKMHNGSRIERFEYIFGRYLINFCSQVDVLTYSTSVQFLLLFSNIWLCKTVKNLLLPYIQDKVVDNMLTRWMTINQVKWSMWEILLDMNLYIFKIYCLNNLTNDKYKEFYVKNSLIWGNNKCK